ncbi:extracellular solute-binding protein [Kozakia baliensis]|uniref:Opine/polyamine ABC transporter substrate-binding protein n=1 Tax=Kozakia baliensis TaxID=153496 RepID=A0A1D8UXQ7_9PROT|nr:extracellular solute-binding protein [Kozakia baliensis]AOX18399.1 opine/polyamine ABC transporter substrate-binding protein [Kozakia baliensis]GBR34169.1 spermidine/putrescine-binding periplasmic protein [Kozakia baliensis NRIC 0488]GEL65162.1 polyamine ABC transporter substrate-binding protein [Kozakia baliensis]
MTERCASLLSRRAALLGLGTSVGAGFGTRARAWTGGRGRRTLTVSGFHGPFQKAFEATIITPFEHANPGVTVVYRPVLNSAQLLAMLRLERDASEIDIAIADISIAILATAEGLTAPLTDADVPNRAALHDWARDPGMNGLAFSRDNLALIHDRRTLPPPTSWMDLGRPELVDQVSMPVQDTRGVALLPVLTRMAGGDYRQGIEPGLALMRRFAPNVASWNAQPDIYTLVLAQTVALGVGWNGRGQMIGRESPGTIGATIPKEGSVAQINTLNLTAGSTAGDLGRAFIDHALSAPAQQAFAAWAYYGPTNRNATLPDTLSHAIFGSTETAEREMHIDWAFISAHYSAWIRRIQREVISG